MTLRAMTADDVPGVVALQPDAFPPPFNPDYHWRPEHIATHVATFPEGQFVVEDAGRIVGACENERLRYEAIDWTDWMSVTGGPRIGGHIPDGDAIFGLDIAVALSHRRRGVGRMLYEARFDFVRRHGLRAYVTGCRLPDLAASGTEPEAYAREVVAGIRTDRTLTPLLRMGMTFVALLPGFMDDPESRNYAARLEWTP